MKLLSWLSVPGPSLLDTIFLQKGSEACLACQSAAVSTRESQAISLLSDLAFISQQERERLKFLYANDVKCWVGWAGFSYSTVSKVSRTFVNLIVSLGM